MKRRSDQRPASPRHGDGAQLQLVQSVGNGIAVGLQLNGHCALCTASSASGDPVALEVLLQTGIIDLVDGGMIAGTRQPSWRGAVALHTDVQRSEAAGDQEGAERAHNGAGHILQPNTWHSCR